MAKVLGPFDHLSDTQLSRILELWNSSYPVGINYADLGAFKAFLDPLAQMKHYIILSLENEINGWMMTFDRNNERWFSIIISDNAQGKGYGKTLIEHVLNEEPRLCGWVVDHDKDLKADGSPYPSPLDFYLKIGFKVVPQERFEKPGISCVKVVSCGY